MAARDRPARPADVDEICGSLPEAWFGTTWGDVPTWLVPHRPGGKEVGGRGFVLYRRPGKTAINPETGEMYDDLLVIRTASEADKTALVEADGPFFTIDHFSGYNAVLVQLARLGEITRAELEEVLSDAWRACAAKSLVKKHDLELADRSRRRSGG